MIHVAVDLNCLAAAAPSPPLTIVNAFVVGHRLSHGTGAACESGIPEDAHRTVPEDGASLMDDIAELAAGTRTDVNPIQPSGSPH